MLGRTQFILEGGLVLFSNFPNVTSERNKYVLRFDTANCDAKTADKFSKTRQTQPFALADHQRNEGNSSRAYFEDDRFIVFQVTHVNAVPSLLTDKRKEDENMLAASIELKPEFTASDSTNKDHGGFNGAPSLNAERHLPRRRTEPVYEHNPPKVNVQEVVDLNGIDIPSNGSTGGGITPLDKLEKPTYPIEQTEAIAQPGGPPKAATEAPATRQPGMSSKVGPAESPATGQPGMSQKQQQKRQQQGNQECHQE